MADEKREERYNLFAVMGKSHRDLRLALLRDLGATNGRSLATLEAKIDALAQRLGKVERMLAAARGRGRRKRRSA